MRILIVCKKLNDGGAERVCASWANGLSALGHEVDILTNLNLPVTYPTVSSVGLIHLEKYDIGNKLERALTGWLRSLLQVRRLSKAKRYDAVLGIMYREMFPLRIATWLSSRKIPVIMTDHNPFERPAGARMPLRQWLKKFIFNRMFDRVTVLTKPDRDILHGYGIDNVTVLHNPLFLNPLKEVPEKERIVLAVGRLNDWHCKGFDLLIKAWNKVREDYPDWKLRVVGSGSEENVGMLMSLADDPSSVEILPYTTDIAGQYREAAVFCLSSRYEGWGLVLVEAMSQGCAAIACDYKGRQAEIVQDGVNGLLCPTDDSDALAERMSRLLGDDALRARIQENAMRGLEKYNESNVARNLLRVIERTAESIRRRRSQ